MDKSKIYYGKVKLNDPVMIVGLPGIGSVGSLVAEHLKNELKAKKFATLYSPHFPFQVIMLKSGAFRLVNNRFYYYRNRKGGSDIILLLGDCQPMTPEGQYDVNEKIVEFFKMLGGRKLYTIGGISLSSRYVKSPRVFSIATDVATQRYMKKQGVSPVESPGMSVIGSAGMIVAFSKRHGIKAACMMGETGLLEVDANSAKAVLQVITKMLGIDVNLENIEKLKGETEKMLRELEEASKGIFPTQPDQGDRGTLSYIR